MHFGRNHIEAATFAINLTIFTSFWSVVHSHVRLELSGLCHMGLSVFYFQFVGDVYIFCIQVSYQRYDLQIFSGIPYIVFSVS